VSNFWWVSESCLTTSEQLLVGEWVNLVQQVSNFWWVSESCLTSDQFLVSEWVNLVQQQVSNFWWVSEWILFNNKWAIFGEWVSESCLTTSEQFFQIKWWEQVIFWWDDDVCFVLDQYNRLDFIVLAHWNNNCK